MAATTSSGAVRVHHTQTSGGRWDGDRAERRLGDDDPQAYRRAFAWVDPENADAKTAAKFPHHDVDAGGRIGAANVRACRSGIGILNGARGGADLPARDRGAVYRHLAAHLRDADVEPAPLRR